MALAEKINHDVIDLLGRADVGDMLRKISLEAGATSYLLKPFATSQVVEAVSSALMEHWERANRELRAESVRSLETLLGLMGYPAEWAIDLERRAWERGEAWRTVAEQERPA